MVRRRGWKSDEMRSRITDPHRQVINIVAKSSVPFSPHDLRRTFASIVSRLGDRLSYFTAKRLLNHRTSDVTQGYIQFDLEQLRGAMQAVEDFVLDNVGAATKRGNRHKTTTNAPPRKHQLRSSRQQALAV